MILRHTLLVLTRPILAFGWGSGPFFRRWSRTSCSCPSTSRTSSAAGPLAHLLSEFCTFFLGHILESLFHFLPFLFGHSLLPSAAGLASRIETFGPLGHRVACLLVVHAGSLALPIGSLSESRAFGSRPLTAGKRCRTGSLRLKPGLRLRLGPAVSAMDPDLLYPMTNAKSS